MLVLGLASMHVACKPNSSGNVYFIWRNLHFYYNLAGERPTWKLTLSTLYLYGEVRVVSRNVVGV